MLRENLLDVVRMNLGAPSVRGLLVKDVRASALDTRESVTAPQQEEKPEENRWDLKEDVGEIYERDKDCLEIKDEGECDSHPMCVYTHRKGKSSCGSKKGVRQGEVYQGPMLML